MVGAPPVAATTDETTPVPAADTITALEAPVNALWKPKKELTPELRAIETEKRGLRRKRLKTKAEKV